MLSYIKSKDNLYKFLIKFKKKPKNKDNTLILLRID